MNKFGRGAVARRPFLFVDVAVPIHRATWRDCGLLENTGSLGSKI
jgi:hypothetical protein